MREALVAESADVLYHLLVLWVAGGVEPSMIWAELEHREGVSGVAEKGRPARCRCSKAAGPGKSPRMERTIMPVSGLGSVRRQQHLRAPVYCERRSPRNRVYEDEWAVAFHDIAPQAPMHVLVVPRGRFVSLADFSRRRVGC